MAIPNLFITQGEVSVPTYNTFDVLIQKGILVVYGGDNNNNGTKEYLLSGNKFYSSVGETQTTGTTPTDIDFDVKLGQTILIDGDVIVNVPSRVQTAGSHTAVALVYIRKWDGTTETDLGSATSSIGKTWGANESRVHCLKIAISKQVIKSGETLRITLQAHGDASKTIDWFHDPAGRSTINTDTPTAESTQFAAFIPIQIDL